MHRSRRSEDESPSDERTRQCYFDAERPPIVETGLCVRNRHTGRRREMHSVGEADAPSHVKAPWATIRKSGRKPQRRGEYDSREEPENN
jgi:hypothetical protein